MGWKGAMRSAVAIHRRAKREAEREQRAYEKEQKQLQEMHEIAVAEQEVEEYKEYVSALRSLHTSCGETIDWEAVLSSPEPRKPSRNDEHEKIAQDRLDSYRPGIFDKLFNRTSKKICKLESEVIKGRENDEDVFLEEMNEYKSKFDKWSVNVDLAENILSGNKQAYLDYIKNNDIFNYLGGLVESVRVDFSSEYVVSVDISTYGRDVVPDIVKTTLKSGKLSMKNMNKLDFYKLYRDYVCGCVLRVARELFARLPLLEMSLVTANANIFNQKTGHMENVSILSVAIPRDTLSMLNFINLDPSLAMDNFTHNITFKQTSGFDSVEKLVPSDFESK